MDDAADITISQPLPAEIAPTMLTDAIDVRDDDDQSGAKGLRRVEPADVTGMAS